MLPCAIPSWRLWNPGLCSYRPSRPIATYSAELLRSKRSKKPRTANQHPAFEAGIPHNGVTPEHLETLRSLGYIFSTSEKHNLLLRADGFLPVSRLLQHPLLANTSFKCLDDIVGWDKQRRFELLYRPLAPSPPFEDWWLRLRNGFEPSKDLSLRRVTSPDRVPFALHCTTPELWKSIERFGIPREDPYLHLTTSIPGRESIFTKRKALPKSSETNTLVPEIKRPNFAKVIIYIDIAKAMAARIPFYVSKQGTIATPGNVHGVLEPRFFRHVDLIKIRMKRVLGQDELPHPTDFKKEPCKLETGTAHEKKTVSYPWKVEMPGGGKRLEDYEY